MIGRQRGRGVSRTLGSTAPDVLDTAVIGCEYYTSGYEITKNQWMCLQSGVGSLFAAHPPSRLLADNPQQSMSRLLKL
ncbi:hypothetical protein WOLCODRAFT_24171 [Wolfiporia cocos MD-104 SS10]|uniref:Uncharacterized protein n=1 Tax=Wolfiporia cocos (strain MD-104) TaxID=742152 RepID=A0A2H3JUY0_WOLCO|nr:hypothetical protein WOLCODRAFT_24171 [Wolfiporia cocos MD-104 SS10]